MGVEDRLGSITGQIRIDGKPAEGLEASLLPRAHFYRREDAIATVMTDQTGRYHFAEVPTGFYWISVHAPGYLNAVNWDDEGPGRNISVAEGQSVEEADLDLIRGGVITGQITDAEGKPVADEYVELTFADEGRLHDDTLDLYYSEDDEFPITDSNGRYRIYGIPAGRYLASLGIDVAKVTGATRDRPGSTHPTGQVEGDHYFEQTFHPGVRDRTRAKVIDVSAGSEVQDVDITVGRSFRAYSVSGRVVDAETRDPICHCYIQMGPYTGGGYASSYIFGPDVPSDTDYDGNFRIEGLIPWRFLVSAQFEGETEFYCTPVEFEVKDRDISGLEIKAHRGVTLSGSVTVEGTEEVTTKLAQLKVHTTSDRHDIGSDSREAAVNSDGSFTIRGLRPGSVRVDLGFEEATKYFSMVRIEYPDSAGEIQAVQSTTVWHPWDAPSLPLGERGLMDVRVVVVYHNGRIKGRASIAGGKLDPNTRLHADISRRGQKGTTWRRSMEVDPNGNFSIEGLDPGEYEISIYDDEMRTFYETKRVIVNKDSESVISFVIDLIALKKRD
jgi:hypothetical protein